MQSIILSLLGSYIQGSEFVWDCVGSAQIDFSLEHVNWEQVRRLSVEQAVAGIVFGQLARSEIGRTVPQQVMLQWFAAQQQIERRNRVVNVVLGELAEPLQSNDIPYKVLKGQELAKYYPNPLWRVPGDIDIYVGKTNFEKAKALLINSLQLSEKTHEDLKHFSFTIKGVMVELHYYAALIPGKKQNLFFQQMMEEELEYSNSYTLSPRVNLVYTFIHYFIHFIGSGASLKQLVDVAILMKKTFLEGVGTKDEREIRTLLDGTGFLKVWQVFGCVLVKEFGFSKGRIPCYCEQYETVAERVMTTFFDDSHTKNAKNVRQNKWSSYACLIKSHFRLYSLFPQECCAFLGRQLENTWIKYINLLGGELHP